jgi:hypothetical protein
LGEVKPTVYSFFNVLLNILFILLQSAKQERMVKNNSTKLTRACAIKLFLAAIEQRTLINVNNYLNTNIYSYLEMSGGQSSNLYLNVVHFFSARVY